MNIPPVHKLKIPPVYKMYIPPGVRSKSGDSAATGERGRCI